MQNPLYTYILNIYMIWFGWLLWYINHCRLFNAKSSYTYIFNIYIIWFGWVLWHINYCRLFNAKSSYTYILDIYMIWFGWVLWHIKHCRLFNAKSSLSSSSSCRAASADIPDPLSPFLPIIHRLRQVFRVTSCVLT